MCQSTVFISTHTSLAGRDLKVIFSFYYLFISTHTSLAGRDIIESNKYKNRGNFYSHVPRGTRPLLPSFQSPPNNFYSHVPRGTRQEQTSEIHKRGAISTHTSLAGRDMPWNHYRNKETKFLLTRPSRDATSLIAIFHMSQSHFYSHVPRGTRQC